MKTVGIVILAMATLIAFVPRSIDCQAEGHSITTSGGKSVPMRCHYAALAEMALAIPLLAVGASMAMRSRRQDRAVDLGLVGMALGISVALIPSLLIGVCPNGSMNCNNLMRPLLLYAGILITILCGGTLAFARKPPIATPSLGSARSTG